MAPAKRVCNLIQLATVVIILKICRNCKGTTDVFTKEITPTVNSQVDLPCLVNDTSMAVWLHYNESCGSFNSLTIGDRLFDDQSYSLDITVHLDTTSSYDLRIKAVTEDMGGTYICSSAGTRRAEILLKVKGQMCRALSEYKERKVFTNTATTLPCVISNQLYSMWLFSKYDSEKNSLTLGTFVLADEVLYSLSIHDSGGSRRYDLMINIALPEMNGTYICQERGVDKARMVLSVNESIGLLNTPLVTIINSTITIPCFCEDISLMQWFFVKTNYTTKINFALGNIGVFPRYSSSYTLFMQGHINYLEIMRAEEDLRGIYSCNEENNLRTSVSLTIEVPHNVQLELNNVKVVNKANITIDHNYDVRCSATGGKPMVTLTWKVNGVKEKYGVETGSTVNGTYSTFNYRPKHGDKNISCVTGGQVKIPRMEETIRLTVFYPPTCLVPTVYITPDRLQVHCVCTANPSITVYKIIVNGEPFIDKILTSFSSQYPANISCDASNAVGSTRSDQYVFIPAPTTVEPSTPTAVIPSTNQESYDSPAKIIIIISIIFIFLIGGGVAAASVWYRRRHSLSVVNVYFTQGATPDSDSRSTVTLSSRPRRPSPVTQRRPISETNSLYQVVSNNHCPEDVDLSNPKPIGIAEGSEYNEQYFQRGAKKNTQNEYELADKRDDDPFSPLESESCASSFSDFDYFSPGTGVDTFCT